MESDTVCRVRKTEEDLGRREALIWMLPLAGSSVTDHKCDLCFETLETEDASI